MTHMLMNETKSGTVKKVGLLGGTFDPIHLTHLHMAEVAKSECQLDEVWFIPANIPPHKQSKDISSGEERIEMVKRAIAPIPYFKLSTVEFLRKGPSYTVDTLCILRQEHPQVEFYFIVGADMVELLPKWHQITELLAMVSFICVGRPGWKLSIDQPFKNSIMAIEMIPSHISSTLIREYKTQGKSIRFLVPEGVYEYIEENQLYE